jgi:cation:H+ antiporter
MLVPFSLFVIGMAGLLYGAHRVVKDGSRLALYHGVSTMFIGVTIVSIGTSVPEMATSLFSAWYGAGDIVVGNIVGSETAQITLAIGIVALIAPIVAERDNVMVYGGGMILAMIIMILVLEDGVIIRSEGFLMMFSYVFFLYHLYTTEGGEEVVEEVDEDAKRPKKAIPGLVLGLVLVGIGGHLMVTNGVAMARLLQVPEYLIGLLTGLGTTLPEIGVAGLAAHRGREGISAGSILGSNITDPVFSLGFGAFAAQIAVTDPSAVLLSAGYMLAAATVVIGLFYWRGTIDRNAAIICILLYLPAFLIL